MALASNVPDPSLKKKKTVIIRNVLSSSAEDHWPVLPDHETEILKEELVRNFSMLKATKVFHAKWSMTTQEEQLMSSKRLECTEVVSKSRAVIRHLRSFIFLGMNALSRAIEGGTVASCLVASDVTPSTLVKPVIQLAISAQTPVFVIKGLKRFCLDSMGFPCIAIGFAKFVACNGEVNPFEEACSLVVQFYNNQRSQSHEAVVHIEENSTKLKSQLPVHTPSTNVCATMPNDSSDFLSAPYSYHLIRGSKYERSYTPDAYSQHKQTHETSTLDVTGLQTKPTEKLSAKLNLPSVLRIKGNPFKLKRKKKKW